MFHDRLTCNGPIIMLKLHAVFLKIAVGPSYLQGVNLHLETKFLVGWDRENLIHILEG